MKTLAEFTANDTIVGDPTAYAAFTADLEASLHPWGMLEIIFAAEIVRATWRLQHVTIDETYGRRVSRGAPRQNPLRVPGHHPLGHHRVAPPADRATAFGMKWNFPKLSAWPTRAKS